MKSQRGSNPTMRLEWFSGRVRVSPCAATTTAQKWNQRKQEKDRPTTAVDYTVNHLRTDVHAEETDHENTKAIP